MESWTLPARIFTHSVLLTLTAANWGSLWIRYELNAVANMVEGGGNEENSSQLLNYITFEIHKAPLDRRPGASSAKSRWSFQFEDIFDEFAPFILPASFSGSTSVAIPPTFRRRCVEKIKMPLMSTLAFRRFQVFPPLRLTSPLPPTLVSLAQAGKLSTEWSSRSSQRLNRHGQPRQLWGLRNSDFTSKGIANLFNIKS